MRIDLGMVLAIIFEYIIFIYYADTLFYRKRNKYLCYAIIVLVYIADLFICARGKIVVNTLTFVVIHLVIFGVCYRISWKSALFQSILLAAITSACEFLVIFIPYIRIIPDNTIAMTSSQSLILTFASKLLYLIGIMIISRVFCKKQKNVQATSLGLLSIPILTVIIIMLVMKVNTTSHLLSLVCFILIIMNIIIFAINQKLMIMETEKAELEAQQLKEKFDYDEYMMLKENNQQASILNHDFKEHIGALSSLIGADNETAQEYIKSITGNAPTAFIYPFGEESGSSLEILKEAGFLSTLNCTEKLNYVTKNPESLYELGRFRRDNAESTAQLMEKISKK